MVKSAAKTINLFNRGYRKFESSTVIPVTLNAVRNKAFQKIGFKYYILLNMTETMVLRIINQQPFFQYSMTNNQIVTYPGIQPNPSIRRSRCISARPRFNAKTAVVLNSNGQERSEAL
jgi:hypothetical protein